MKIILISNLSLTNITWWLWTLNFLVRKRKCKAISIKEKIKVVVWVSNIFSWKFRWLSCWILSLSLSLSLSCGAIAYSFSMSTCHASCMRLCVCVAYYLAECWAFFTLPFNVQTGLNEFFPTHYMAFHITIHEYYLNKSNDSLNKSYY